jgi:GEVED domain/Secretion system C-terminal sorting domain/Metallo-peptidase family M12B Reprolysin-like
MLNFSNVRASILGLLVTLSFTVSAQTPVKLTESPHLSCGTPPATEDQIRYTLEVVAKQAIARNAGTTCIPIKAHVVLNDDGSGGISILNLNKGIANLNNVYRAANIEFYWCDLPDYANSTDYVSYNTSASDAIGDPDTEPNLVALFTTATNAVNIYFVETITRSSGTAAGYAYYPSETAQSNRIVMTYGVTSSYVNGTFAHEFGHYFDLYHTHQGTEQGNSNFNAENVPRSGPNANCSETGDLLCDTQADPRYNSTLFNLATCTYTGTETDINGVTYTPPIENIMSYFPDQCGVNYFTPEQYAHIGQGLIIRQSSTNNYSLDCPPQTVAAATGLGATFSGGSVNLTWIDNASNDMGYLIERSSTSATSDFEALTYGGTAISATTYSDPSIVSNTTYYYRIKAANGNCNTYSNVATVTVPLTYCNPSYTNVCYSNSGTPMSMNGFTLASTGGSTLLSSTNNGCSGALSDYTNLSANVMANTSYNYTVDLGTNGGAFFQQNISIWLDRNHDGDFADTQELLGTFNGTNASSSISGSIVVPQQTINGATRLRIRSTYYTLNVTNPCTSLTYGETEDYTLNVSNGVLSVELVSFKAKPVGKSAILTWETANEQSNSHFIIERSSDGKTFVELGQLKGNGTNSSNNLYTFTDEKPAMGVNYYRLKDVDLSQAEHISRIVALTFSEKETLNIFPNPTNQSSVTVAYNTESKGEVLIEWIDILGRVRKQIQQNAELGENRLNINISDLEKGIYFARIKRDNQPNNAHIIRFIKQ